MANDVYINVNGTWKQADAYYVNVNGTWKTGSEFQVKVSSDWKGGAAAAVGLPTFAQILGLDYVDFTLPVIGTVDSNADVNSLGLDFVDFTLPVIGKSNPNSSTLVLHLDAGNSSSYSGSGTTWSDLSGKGNHATLVNSPTYSSSDGGYLSFDGSNDYATLPAINISGNEITFSIWTYAESDTVAALIFFGDSTDTSGWTGRQLNVHLPYTNSYYFDKGHDGTTVDRISGSLPNSDWQNAWVNWAFTANASTGSMKIYRNGSSYASATGKTRTFNSANVDIRRIARFTSTYYDGRISKIFLYKQELTAAEVLHNYNLDKATYGH